MKSYQLVLAFYFTVHVDGCKTDGSTQCGHQKFSGAGEWEDLPCVDCKEEGLTRASFFLFRDVAMCLVFSKHQQPVYLRSPFVGCAWCRPLPVYTVRLLFGLVYRESIGRRHTFVKGAQDASNPPTPPSRPFNLLRAKQFPDLSGSPSTVEMVLLTGNAITNFPANTFNTVKDLYFITLSKNKLTEVPAKVFDGLTLLEYLSLWGTSCRLIRWRCRPLLFVLVFFLGWVLEGGCFLLL